LRCWKTGVDADYSFGSYHSKTDAIGHTLHYSRKVEIKELSVPLSKMDESKKDCRGRAQYGGAKAGEQVAA
jgi:hypothetical protein